MQVSLVSSNGLERRLVVTVPGDLVASNIEARLKEIARTARMKGFRPGKVPFNVVRQQYGGQVHSEAVSELVQRSFAEAVNQQKLRPAGDPRIEPLKAAEGTELQYAATFEVLPEISIRPLEELKLERPAATVGEADVDAMIESMRRQKPVYTPVERAAGKGDRVTLAFEGRIDGELFPGGKGDDLKVVLGAGNILAELDEALVGMRPGESKTVPARFPDDYGAKAVAGKEAVFTITPGVVEAQSLPEVDEEFVRGYGLAEGGLDEFRNQVRASMEREMAEAIRQRMRVQILDALYRENPLELPKVMVEEQIRDLQVQTLRRMGVQKIEQAPPREPFEEPAKRRVALGLIVGEIVRSNNIRVDRSRIEQRLNDVVAPYPDPESIRKQYLQSREAMAQLESAVLEDQALDWVQSKAQVADKPSSFSELTGFGRNNEVSSG